MRKINEKKGAGVILYWRKEKDGNRRYANKNKSYFVCI